MITDPEKVKDRIISLDLSTKTLAVIGQLLFKKNQAKWATLFSSDFGFKSPVNIPKFYFFPQRSVDSFQPSPFQIFFLMFQYILWT